MTKKMVTCKDLSKLEFDGLYLVPEIVNNNVRSLTITDARGNAAKIMPARYGDGLEVLVDEPPPPYHRIEGTIEDVEAVFPKLYNDPDDAQIALREINDKLAGYNRNLRIVEVPA